MKIFILAILICSHNLLAQTITSLDRINLDEVSNEHRPLVHLSAKFKISLMNGFCETSKSEVNVTKEDIANNLSHYRKELPRLIEKFEALVNELKPGFFTQARNFYPLDIHLSLDGHDGCYNATAEGNHIELPAQSDPEYIRGVFNLLYHEIGHTMSHFNGSDQNLFDETIADAMSMVLLDPNGIFNLGAAAEREEWKRKLLLGERDPHALASELEIEYSSIPSWLKENNLKYKCSSNDYSRDLRSTVPLVDVMEGGGESYIVSCAFHSFLGKLGKILGKERVLKTFIRTYLNQPFMFNEIEIPKILSNLFRGIDHQLIDPSLARLKFRPANVTLNLELNPYVDEGGEHYRLTWIHPGINLDWGIVAFKDQLGTPIASFSLMSSHNGAVFTPQSKESCKDDRLVCYCPGSGNQIGLQLAWMSVEGARTQEKLLRLPVNSKGCFELGLAENLKTK